MDSEMNISISRLLLFFLRILQCSGSFVVILTEILRHTHVIYIIEWEMNMKLKENNYELFFEYFVMNLGFVTSAFYIIRFNQQWKQEPYKCDVFIDCVLMNSWMIFGILRLSPQFDDADLLTCSQYEDEKRKGCIIYVSTLVLGYCISASYFLTAMVSTWIRAVKNPLVNSINNSNNVTNIDNHSSFTSSKSTLNRTEFESNGIRNSQIINDIPEIITREGEECTETSLKEFIEHNKHLAHLFNNNLEFSRTDGTIIILRKPTPPFLMHEPSSHNSSLYENNLDYNKKKYFSEYSLDSSKRKYSSEYSLDSSFSRTYGSIIIPRRYLSTSAQSEADTNTSSKFDGSIIIGRNQINSTYSDSSKRLSSTLSDKTSRSSKYDGSIIIKLVA